MSDPPRLKVVIDDRPLRRTRTGVGNYIAELLRLLRRSEGATGVRAAPFLASHGLRRENGADAADDADVPAAAQDPQDVGGGRKPWWMRALIQTAYGAAFRTLARGRYDLLHEPNHIPVRCGLPTVTTIHDLSVLDHPEWHPADRVRWYERDFEAGVRRTRVFLAASHYTRQRMIERLCVPPERIVVTYQAPRPAFTPQPAKRVAQVLERLDLPGSFFLFVGTLEPRKNVPGLLEAFAGLARALRAGFPLVIAGPWGWKAEQLRELLRRHALSADVRLLGYQRDPTLAALYSACTAFVWPTFYEGFGLPPLEAMACGAPVITSQTTSLPEVVGRAGRLLDPTDAAAWTEALRAAAEDRAWRAAARARSLEQAAGFTAESFVQATVQGYRAATGE